MKLRKLSYIVASVLLLQLLAGCFRGRAEATAAPGPTGTDGPAPSSILVTDPTKTPETSQEPGPEVSEDPDIWDPSHTLDIAFTPAEGLELPVRGATGYASIRLPLWGELPEGEEGKLATIYAPPEPVAVTPPPEPSPEPGPEPPASSEPGPDPTPAETAPAPAETDPGSDVLASAFVTPSAGGEPSGGEPSEDPSPAPSQAEPDPEATPSQPPESAQPEPDPSAGPSPSGEPSQEPEPSPEPEPTASPEPEPTPTPDPMEGALMVLEPGTAFAILNESGDWWMVQLVSGETGWVEHRYCLINLPDVIPSIIYNDTNAYSSVFVSSGKDIPNVTGQALYQCKARNERLGRTEFMMPVLYAMAKNVCRAQQKALSEGNTLVLYEGFRPYEAQMSVVNNLSALSRRDPAVRAGITTRPWNISWFIATGASNHQEGYAMDVSLAKVYRSRIITIGGHEVVQVDEYEEYAMPTPIHELSMAAATYTSPVAIFSKTAWRTAEMAPAMAASQPARALQRYCTGADLTPLASEWWHFNDLAAYSQIRNHPSTGRYLISQCLSTVP